MKQMLSRRSALASAIEHRWRRLRITRHSVRQAITRYRRALAYARNKMSERQALDIVWDCQPVAGSYALVSLDVSAVVEEARNRWQGHPDLDRLCREAADRVNDKWPGENGDVAATAIDWAIDYVERYAKEQGIDLLDIGEE